jgi:hypothetical protein
MECGLAGEGRVDVDADVIRTEGLAIIADPASDIENTPPGRIADALSSRDRLSVQERRRAD